MPPLTATPTNMLADSTRGSSCRDGDGDGDGGECRRYGLGRDGDGSALACKGGGLALLCESDGLAMLREGDAETDTGGAGRLPANEAPLSAPSELT
jgi:hypothetical protein